MSPLELFRRNQKVMMAGLIMLAMFAFVVLPTVQTYLQRSGPGMTDPVLASFNGVPLTESRVMGFTQAHQSTVRYLTKLGQETIKRGGMPQVPGFSIDQQTQNINGVGINSQPGNDISIRTLQFAAEAQKQGFEMDDTAIELWMDQFTDGKISKREMYGLLRHETNNRMGELQLFDMLRKQLLSQLYYRGASASVARGQFPVQSPLDHWKNFLKLNQKATVTAYGVLTNDYISETDSNPADSEVLAVYNDGKDRYASEQSAEPGFRRRDTATFEYVLADLQKFRDAEVAKLSDEEIKAEYDRRVSGGDFQLPPEIKTEPAVTEEPEVKEEPETSEPEMKENEESATAPAEASEEKTESKPEPKKEETTEEEPQTSGKTDAELKQVEDFEKELEEAGKEPESDSPDEADQSSFADRNGVQLVVMQSDKATETETEEAGEEGAEEPAKDASEEDSKDDPPAESEEEKQYREFEEVRDEVAQSMVEDKARVALDKAITLVRNAMKEYRIKKSIYGDGSNEKAEKPERPDLESLATELGLSYRTIGPLDPVQINDEPISKSYEAGSAFSRRGVPFSAMMYGVGGQVNKEVLFREVASVDLEKQLTYLTWKTEETEAYTPELDEVRDEVVDAIRVAQARELAKQAAEALAEKVNSGTPFEDIVRDDRSDNLFKDVGPFSWLNMLGFGSVTIGNVPELDSVGDDFMKAVFTQTDKDCVVAPNQPKRVYYVIDRGTLQPADTDLKGMFQQPQQRMMATFMGDGSAAKIQQGFFDAVDERTGFKVPEAEQQ